MAVTSDIAQLTFAFVAKLNNTSIRTCKVTSQYKVKFSYKQKLSFLLLLED